MKVVAVIQARMSSSRFPGKVLAPLAGKPSILRQVERVQRASTLEEVVVATSVDATDDELANILDSQGIRFFRGPLNNVLERFTRVVEEVQPEVIVRLTGDCPFTSPTLIDEMVSRFLISGLDYASNSLQPSYPDGLDVEVMLTEALMRLTQLETDPDEREHVTLGIYRRHHQFRIANFAGPINLSHLRWTMDDYADYEFVAEVFRDLYSMNPEFDLPDILAWLKSHPERSRTVADAPRNAALIGLDTRAMDV